MREAVRPDILFFNVDVIVNFDFVPRHLIRYFIHQGMLLNALPEGGAPPKASVFQLVLETQVGWGPAQNNERDNIRELMRAIRA